MTQEEFDKLPLLDQILYDETGMLVENHPSIAEAMDKYHQAKLKLLGVGGVSGSFGPNDGGYIHQRLVNSAKEIKKAQELYSQGHYAHSNAKIIPQGHPLRVIMEQLAELDEQYAMYANTTPNKDLFSTYEPPIEDTIRWDKYAGEDGK